MNSIHDIALVQVALALLLLFAPAMLFRFFRTALAGPLVIAAGRMIIQLAGIALYLEFIFAKNSMLLNGIWLCGMIAVTAFTTVNRSGIDKKRFFAPVVVSIAVSVLLTAGFIFGTILPPALLADARYLIPVSGMIIGNSMGHNIVGLSNYFSALRNRPQLYYFILANTGSTTNAVRPYIAEAFKAAFNPLIANMSVIGLVSLPGMMTGQILGGSPPLTAIKYQIVIMVAIFTACSGVLALSIFLTRRQTFDAMGRIKDFQVKPQRKKK